VADQVAQQVELARREVDALRAAMRLVRPEVDLDVADAAGLEAGGRPPARRKTARTRASSSVMLNGLVT
jgi:hypothetical protein